MRKRKGSVLVIGDSRMDYLSKTIDEMKEKKENLGTLFTTFGGPGRNVTENLIRLSDKVSFITVLGEDHLGLSLKQNLISLGVDVYSINTKYPTGIYNSICDTNGKRISYIIDTRGTDSLKPNDLKEFDSIIKAHDYIVLDGTLNEKIINYIFKTYKNKKYYVDGVSTFRVKTFLPHLKEIELFKSNVTEAEHLLDCKKEPEDLVQLLLDKGCKQVVLSHTELPIVYGTKQKGISHEPIVVRQKITRSNGNGDALFAGIVHCLVAGMQLKQAVKFGLNMSYQTLGVNTAVDPKIGDLL